MSIQPISSAPSPRIASYTPAPVHNQFISLHKASDAVQFGHQHAHGKTCTDHNCHDHHHHDHPPKPAANNMFSKTGLWLSEFFGGMLTDLQKLGNALLRLFGIKPKPDKAHHTHDESCKHHHHGH